MMIWQKWSCSRPHGGRRIQHSFRMQPSEYTSTCRNPAPLKVLTSLVKAALQGFGVGLETRI